MRYFLFFACFLLAVNAAHAERYTFGPKAGQEIPLEEEMAEARQRQMIDKLGGIEELMKQNQELLSKQNQMLDQQNQLLNQMYQLDYQDAMNRQQQQQQQQQYQLQMQQQYQQAPQVVPQQVPQAVPQAGVPMQIVPAQ